MPAERFFEGDDAFGTAANLTLLDQREQNEPAVRIPGGTGSINVTWLVMVQAQAWARSK
jgi:hypothetical protein